MSGELKQGDIRQMFANQAKMARRSNPAAPVVDTPSDSPVAAFQGTGNVSNVSNKRSHNDTSDKESQKRKRSETAADSREGDAFTNNEEESVEKRASVDDATANVSNVSNKRSHNDTSDKESQKRKRSETVEDSRKDDSFTNNEEESVAKMASVDDADIPEEKDGNIAEPPRCTLDVTLQNLETKLKMNLAKEQATTSEEQVTLVYDLLIDWFRDEHEGWFANLNAWNCASVRTKAAGIYALRYEREQENDEKL